MGYQRNTRHNATAASHNTAPLSFNPMSHVASNARQSSLCVGAFYLNVKCESARFIADYQSGDKSPHSKLLYLFVLALGFHQNRQIRVRIFPEREEILIRLARFR
jgi:hypothetical protein